MVSSRPLWKLKVAFGPLLPFTSTSGCCSAARHCGHSCILQHFLTCKATSKQHRRRRLRVMRCSARKVLLSLGRCTKPSNCLSWKRNRPTEQKERCGPVIESACECLDEEYVHICAYACNLKERDLLATISKSCVCSVIMAGPPTLDANHVAANFPVVDSGIGH
jgi:hypothetical protein